MNQPIQTGGPEQQGESGSVPKERPTVVLVHGAFAESSSWNGVIGKLQALDLEVVAVANPLRSVAGDAAYVRDVIAAIGKPVVLAGHSYGGIVITEAAAGIDAVAALVYVAAFAPTTARAPSNCRCASPGARSARPSPPIPFRRAATNSLSGRTPSTGSSPPTFPRLRPR